jgi:hypothetical protein
MSKLEVVDSWKCTDGEVFTDIDEANKHQAEVDFVTKYSDGRQFWAERAGYADPDSMIEWLYICQNIVQDFYKAMEGK